MPRSNAKPGSKRAPAPKKAASHASKRPATATRTSAKGGRKSPPGKARKPATLPKSDGDAGVQAFIASMEPWQGRIATRVDALIAKHVPGVRKGMRWRCPFYGVDGKGWFMAFAAFQRHMKFTFFNGASLTPAPPVGKLPHVRSLDVRQSDTFDEGQMVRWIKQAASIPGWDGGSTKNGGMPL